MAVVSRLTRLKGLEHFLEAAAIVSARVPDARFLIVGETSPIGSRRISASCSELRRRVSASPTA